MFRPNRTSVTVGVAVVAVVAGPSYVLTGTVVPRAAAEPKAPAALIEFTAEGKLKRPPVGYRKWVSLGTPFNHNDGDDEFHAVYMDPESFAHYEKTGQIRDGTILVKEPVGVGTKEAASGRGYFMGEFKGLQVSIKDSARFKDEPGNWAYFDFGTKYPLRAEASMKPAASCNQCHQDNAKTDWVFSQYYPVLRAAAPRSK
jgi:Cytochrome P460